jgi:hypothetical protein
LQFYAFGSLSTNEFAGHFYDCPESGGASNPACAQYDGEYILRSLGLPTKDWIWRPILALCGFFILYYVLAAIAFSLIKEEIRLGNARKEEPDSVTETFSASTTQKVRPVTMALEDYVLSVSRRRFLKREPWRLSLLNGVNVTFQPGHLNVIL